MLLRDNNLFFLSSSDRNGGKLLGLPIIKLMMASPLYVMIACMYVV